MTLRGARYFVLGLASRLDPFQRFLAVADPRRKRRRSIQQPRLLEPTRIYVKPLAGGDPHQHRRASGHIAQIEPGFDSRHRDALPGPRRLGAHCAPARCAAMVIACVLVRRWLRSWLVPDSTTCFAPSIAAWADAALQPKSDVGRRGSSRPRPNAGEYGERLSSRHASVAPDLASELQVALARRLIVAFIGELSLGADLGAARATWRRVRSAWEEDYGPPRSPRG